MNADARSLRERLFIAMQHLLPQPRQNRRRSRARI